MIAKLRRLLSGALIVSIAGLGVPLPASAGMVATDTAIAAAARDHISSILDRRGARARPEAGGVSPAEVKARVPARRDAGGAQPVNQIVSLPAGADGGAVEAIVGALVLVFLILLITDLLGWTKVFPFTRSIR